MSVNEAIPIANHTAQTVAKKFYDKCIHEV